MLHEIQIMAASDPSGPMVLIDRCKIEAKNATDAAQKYAALFDIKLGQASPSYHDSDDHHIGVKAHDEYAPHSHEVRADHEGVLRNDSYVCQDPAHRTCGCPRSRT